MKQGAHGYVSGGAKGVCERCGFVRRLNDLKKEWSGLRVCSDCYDPRPDTLTPPIVKPEGLPRPDAAPEPPDTFVGVVSPEDL